MRGHAFWYVCASDADGTPTMLRAEREGVSPESLIERISAEHRRGFETFRTSVDNYITTHAPEHEELTRRIHERLNAAGHIRRRPSEPAHDDVQQMLRPARA